MSTNGSPKRTRADTPGTPPERDLFAGLPVEVDPPRERIDLLAGLNPAQREAVTHEQGPLFILAGPGSGKTRVITRRIAWLVRERGVDPARVLAITFTNKAAREMRERVEAILPARGMWVSTFHSMCARILRREIEYLPPFTREFTIYDTSDRNQLVKQILKEGDFDTTRFKPAQVGAWISAWKNGVASGEIDDGSIEGDVLGKALRGYQAALARNNALDFDDLLVKVHELFEAHPGVRDAYATRFLHVMVDEYQDTNRVQYLLTRALASVHGNVAVCGDPDQSIYGWRGADIRNILGFEHDFPSPRVVKLEQNYRSTTTILKAARAVIEHNSERKSKGLWSERGEGARIVVLEAGDENDEAREIAHQIQGLRAQGRPARDVAVFYRVNFMQRALETALRLYQVPYQVVGGLEFYERREIRDLIAYAKLVANPADDVAFRRVVNVPGRGIGEKSVEALAEFAADRRIPLVEAARSSEAAGRVRGRARAGLAEFVALLDGFVDLREAPAEIALRSIVEAIDSARWFAEMTDDNEVDRESNVEELVASAGRYDRMVAESRLGVDPSRGIEALTGGLRGFLQDIALVNDTDRMEDDGDQVALMTLHSAKGLEFPVVFVAGVEEELLPHARAIAEGSDRDDGSDAVEEERRLFYVGLTRARERLILTHARHRSFFGEFTPRCRSRFLSEIPRELVEGYDEEGDADDVLGVYEPPAPALAFGVGDRVSHAHFGNGTIELLQGSGINARAVVRFPAHGSKTLLLQYANLTRIAEGAR